MGEVVPGGGGLEEGVSPLVQAGLRGDGEFAPRVLHCKWRERGPCWGHSLGHSLRDPNNHRIN